MPDQGSRRDFLRRAACAAALGLLAPRALRADARPCALALHNLHTGESLSIVYRENGACVPDSLALLDHLLRDHRSGEAHPIDPALFDQLVELREATGGSRPFEVISGYRSPATNAWLRANGGGVAQRSLHLEGRAIDVRLPGVPTHRLRDAALALARGGVGYYPAPDFVHLDTGRVRRW
jgi:uncharacterized protein YcbK (DUF882 family)